MLSCCRACGLCGCADVWPVACGSWIVYVMRGVEVERRELNVESREWRVESREFIVEGRVETPSLARAWLVTGHRSGVSTCKYSLDVANRPTPRRRCFSFSLCSVSVSVSDAVPVRLFLPPSISHLCLWQVGYVSRHELRSESYFVLR